MPNINKELAISLSHQTLEYLEKRQIQAWLEPKIATIIGRSDLIDTEVSIKDLDVLLVLGGDGTLLNAARKVAEHGVPILGVNLGHLGFLTELEADRLEDALDALIRKEYKLEERMLIACNVIRNGQIVASYQALNDIVITRGTFARIINLRTFVDDQPVVDYQADGIIIATPTGSTAYSLSAGGPIVEPRLDCIIITPICPHTLASRAVVVHHKSLVNVLVQANHRDVMLTIDGQVGFSLQSYDCLEIVKARESAKFVKLQGRDFFAILNSRMKIIRKREDFE